MTAAQAAQDFPSLCALVAKHCGRVEILSSEESQDCVLISKAELESLENALEILADSETTRELSNHLTQLAQIVETGHPVV